MGIYDLVVITTCNSPTFPKTKEIHSLYLYPQCYQSYWNFGLAEACSYKKNRTSTQDDKV